MTIRYLQTSSVDPVTGLVRKVIVLQELINGVWVNVPTVIE